jgi:hypothetical protein
MFPVQAIIRPAHETNHVKRASYFIRCPSFSISRWLKVLLPWPLRPKPLRASANVLKTSHSCARHDTASVQRAHLLTRFELSPRTVSPDLAVRGLLPAYHPRCRAMLLLPMQSRNGIGAVDQRVVRKRWRLASSLQCHESQSIGSKPWATVRRVPCGRRFSVKRSE